MKEIIIIAVMAVVTGLYAAYVSGYFLNRNVTPTTEVGFRAQVKIVRRVRDLRIGETATIYAHANRDGRIFIDPIDTVNGEYMKDQVTRVNEKTYVVTLVSDKWDSPVEPSTVYTDAIYPQVRRLKK